MAIAGALAGFGAGLFYLSNVSQWNPLNSTSLPAMGFNGISVALLASSNPIGTIFSPCSSPTSRSAARMSTKYYPTAADLRPDQRHHHLPVRILHAVPRQDP